MGSPLYSILLVAGILIGAAYWVRVSKNDSRLPFIYLGGLVGAFIGAKLAFLFAEGWMYLGHPQRIPILLSGKSIIGALPGGWAGVEIVKKFMGYRAFTGDRFATILPVPLILGRIGCLHAGCCTGIMCTFGKWPSVPVEIGFQIFAIAALWIMRKNSILPGQHFHLYLIAYGLFRFLHEFLRATPKPFLGLSGYQIVALATVFAAWIAFMRRSRHVNYLAIRLWSHHSHYMDMTVTQFKAKCLGVIEKVQKEKSRVTITRHGRPAAELVPIASSSPGALFGRAAKTTVILGDLLTTGEHWDAED